MEEPASQTPQPWWGRFTIEVGHSALWQLGPLRLQVMRHTHVWELVWSSQPNPLLDSVSLERSQGYLPIPEGASIARFATAPENTDLILTPELADRSVVADLKSSFHILTGDALTFFVSTPLWIRVETSRPQRGDARFLLDIPSWRPSDTWFGPSTREGELCYASRTVARVDLEDVPLHPVRALTRIHVQNRGDAGILLDKLRLPVQHLKLYSDREGTLWTQGVNITQALEDEPGTLQLSKGSPVQAQEATWVADSREERAGTRLRRALRTLWT